MNESSNAREMGRSSVAAIAIALLVKQVLTSWTGMQKLFISMPLFLLVFVTLMHKWDLDKEDKLILKTFKGKQRKAISYKNQVE